MSRGALGSTVVGAWGFGIRDERIYVFRAKATLIATGGAAGLYRPNHPGFSRHTVRSTPARVMQWAFVRARR